MAGPPRPTRAGHRPGAASNPHHGTELAPALQWFGTGRVGRAGPAGAPGGYTPAQVSAVIAVSLTNPRELGLPFASWTLDRLQAYLHEVQGIPMKRTRLDELVLGEGWRWRQQETWFGERVDPACAEKRGSSRRSIPRRRRAVSSSAWMRWAPRAPSASRGGSWCRSRPQPPQCRRAPATARGHRRGAMRGGAATRGAVTQEID